VLVVPVAVLVSLLVFFVNARFRLPAVPMLAVLAGLALDRALVPAAPGRRVGAAAAFLCVTIGSGLLLPRAFSETVRYDEVYGLLNYSLNEQSAGNLSAAAVLLERAGGLVGDRQNPDVARAFVGMGNRLLDRRDLEAAARWYGKATTYDTTYAPAFLMRGVVDLTAGNHDRALGYAHEAIRRDPQMANGWVLRARALLALGRADEARPAAERARALEPQSPLVRELAGQLGFAP
jgi:tetratricopeptide (TPR) repeat protein